MVNHYCHSFRQVLRRVVLDTDDTVAGGAKLRRFKKFHDGAASWDRVERIVACVGAGPQGSNSRFIVTSLSGLSGRTVYQDF